MKRNTKRKTIAIVAGGYLDASFLPQIRSAAFVIGVDAGAVWLLNNGVTPDVAVGDFDSVNTAELHFVKQKIEKVIKYPADKDATDLELAVEYALRWNPTDIVIFGGIGSRADHSMAAVHLLETVLKQGIHASIVHSKNELLLVDRLHSFTKDMSYRYVSVLPYTEEVLVTLFGLRYPLVRTRLIRGTSRGISNEVTAQTGTIEVHEGIALVIRSRD